VLEQYGVHLPTLGHVVLSQRDIHEFIASIFLQNRFGTSLLTAADCAEASSPNCGENSPTAVGAAVQLLCACGYVSNDTV
jgi:hypothetical protein